MIEEKKVHQHGFVRLLEVMGDDEEVVNAARISYGKGTKKFSETRNLIRYLMRHKHTSPFEMCEVKFHLKLPIFIMRQLVRHRTANINEYSGRYSEMSDEFYIPENDYIQKQSKTNNQGRGEESEEKGLVKFEMNRSADGAYHAYQHMLNYDIARELARTVLPVSNYTECIWKIDLHNFFHMVHLRSDSHAQREIQDYSNAMYSLVEPQFPICCEAFEDYVVNARSFSAEEMKIIKDQLDGSWTMDNYDLSKREREEFLWKLSN